MPAPPEANLKTKLEQIFERLRTDYGRPKRPATSDPLELVFWENAAYLLTDERRQKVFELLRERVGLRPRDILAAKPATLLEIAKLGGMRPEVRVERWLTIAQIALAEFQGDLRNVLRLPLKQAKKALQQFPCIGEPGNCCKAFLACYSNFPASVSRALKRSCCSQRAMRF